VVRRVRKCRGDWISVGDIFGCDVVSFPGFDIGVWVVRRSFGDNVTDGSNVLVLVFMSLVADFVMLWNLLGAEVCSAANLGVVQDALASANLSSARAEALAACSSAR
jgi:hypothetical protein